ncbi:hypothetical protein HID58_028592, partial [Brassica napus]
GLILGALFLQPSFLLRVEDQNRYSASRGAHLNLKRAEKARVLVSKIPAMVDTLVAKTRAWEEEHNMSFAYDGVPLLAMLDEYEREDEKRRLREQKKVQEQPHVEQDTAFSTRPSPARPVSAKKLVGARASNGAANGTPNRHLSLNANQNGSRSVAKEEGKSVCNFAIKRYKGTSNSIHADEKKLIHFELDRQMEKNVASSMHT